MNNIFVYCEIAEGKVADVSKELLTKASQLALELGCKTEAIVIGNNLKKETIEIVAQYGADIIHVADGEELYPYRTLPHTAIVCHLFKQEQPQIALFGASTLGRDLAPRVSSKLHSGLTADCTSLEIGDHKEAKTGKEYTNLLYQIRPAFGGNIIATIINPNHRPQMATVREGVMKMEPRQGKVEFEVKKIDYKDIVKPSDFAVTIIDRHISESKINIKGAPIIIAGGYGVGSKENFDKLHELAALLGGEVAASRAAVDAGFAE
ncbi:MAG: electron transfer flavoprotein subunit alpha/FixB family protein, partial [Rikenellaceae bacterium]